MPRSKRAKNVLTNAVDSTPSKSTADLFRNMKLDKGVPPIPFTFTVKRAPYHTPPDTPEATPRSNDVLPAELEYLMDLNAAFLSSLSLYHAHNGASSSVHIKELLPMITKTWRKRAVVLDDLRMLLAIDIDKTCALELRDFGRGGIRLVKEQPRGRPANRATGYIDEARLNARFKEALQERWNEWRAAEPTEENKPEVFSEQLPLVEVVKDASVAKAAPLFIQGQRRLEDIKASQTASEEQATKSKTPAPVLKSNADIQNRGASLLDRILAKQAHAATLPSGPSKYQIEKNTALQRIEDIARVLDLLSAGRPRCSFSMQAMIQQLQQSLRNPISKEQAERCLSLMANEITPGFITMVRNGSVTVLVVAKSGKVDSMELKRRLQIAIEGNA